MAVQAKLLNCLIGGFRLYGIAQQLPGMHYKCYLIV